jgi:hypothetical protein
MSDTPTTFVNFTALDYRGVESLSSYALEQTPITFIPKIQQAYGNRILWNFGDGTSSSSLTAIKSYDFPGQYKVNLVVYDCFDNALFSSQSKTITIYDYVPYTFVIRNELSYYLQPFSEAFYLSPLAELYAYASPLSATIYNGKINGAFQITAFYPHYQPKSDIYVDFRDSGSQDYFDISDRKYPHLSKTFGIYEDIYNYSLSAIQYDEIEKIVPEVVGMYAKIEDSSIQLCLSGDDGAFFVGLSGVKDFYIKDDTEDELIYLDFYFDRNNSYTPNKNINLNNTGITLSCEVLPNVPDHITITTNGYDGEGTAISSFNIPDINYNDVAIPFVIKIKDDDNFTIKNFPIIDQGDIQFAVLSSSSPVSTAYYDISSLNSTLSGENFGSFRGYLKFKNLSSDQILDNYQLRAILSTTSNQLTSYSLTGYSNSFKIYPQDYYEFYKNGEDYNFKETLKDLRFQEFLLDDSLLFDDFLGSVFGDSASSYETLGKKIYEKITNFVQNHSDIDRNEIFSLLSQMEMLDVEQNTYNSSFIRYPEQVRRILNMASIAKNKITGKENRFAEAFARGGQNLGSEINTTTYTVSAGSPLVAFERFSGDYTSLNTFQPVSAAGSFVYPLSTYADTWGWPLVLPNPFSFSDIEKYYTFYEYVSGYENTVYGSSIDFDNTLTTIPLTATSSELFEGGIFENMLVDKFTHLLKIDK